MADEESFSNAYSALAAGTGDFSRSDSQSLATVLQRTPAALAPLRMIVGLTHNQLAVAIRLTDPDARVSGEALKKFERNPPPSPISPRHKKLAAGIANAVTAAMSRKILTVPPSAATYFHSKLDKSDTREGWSSVRADSTGVPYAALIYQRSWAAADRAQMGDTHPGGVATVDDAWLMVHVVGALMLRLLRTPSLGGNG